VDLLLAMQAPLRLERLVPHIAALGVGRLVIAGANKVRSYGLPWEGGRLAVGRTNAPDEYDG